MSIPQPQHRTASPSIDALLALTATDLAAVNTLIVEQMQSDVPLIPQLAAHLIMAGGKRIRPLLTLGSALLCGYQGTRHLNLAACVEFIHTATLLHDDVVDESDRRRGRETANTIWGNKASVLVGDYLFSRAFEGMVADGSLKVLGILSRASAVIAEGEVLQLSSMHNAYTTEEHYMAVIRAKTAALFAAATQVGAVVAEKTATEEQALYDFGLNLGIAFQLADDALDYSGTAATGKTLGNDFAQGKVTLPVILALQHGNDAEKSFWNNALSGAPLEDTAFTTAQQLLEKYQTVAATLTRARAFGAQAIENISHFPDSPIKQALHDVVLFATERPY
jgi:octaprenyl-diphosphate synthase